MRLVDHDQRQPEEEVGPPGVVREQREVQHVRVRHHQVGVLPDQGTLGARRVPVVHRRLHLRDRERAHSAELVARQGLRREQVERRRRRSLDGLGSERQVVDERLPARGPRGHDQVAAEGEHLEPCRLMRVQPFDTDEPHPLTHQRRDPRGERLDDGGPRRELADVDQRRRDPSSTVSDARNARGSTSAMLLGMCRSARRAASGSRRAGGGVGIRRRSRRIKRSPNTR